MTRRKFIKTTGAGAIVTAGATRTGAKSGASRNKNKGSKKEVSTDRAPKPAGPYSQAIISGNTVYVAGQGPFDPKTREMAPTFEQQAAQVFENIKAIVESSGATLANVTKVNVF